MPNVSHVDPGSPVGVYLRACAASSCHPSRSLQRLLPPTFDDIRTLDLRGTIVGRNGATAVFDVCARAPHLSSLSLSDNYLTNEAVAALVLAMKSHESLEKLDLSKNPISHAAGKLLAKYAASNRRIRSIDLTGTLINPALINIIERTCTNRATTDAVAPTPVPSSNAIASGVAPQVTLLPLLCTVLPENGVLGLRVLLASAGCARTPMESLHRAVACEESKSNGKLLLGLDTLLCASTSVPMQSFVALESVMVSSDIGHYALQLLCDAAIGKAVSDDDSSHLALMSLVDATAYDHMSLAGLQCLSAAASDAVLAGEEARHHLHMILEEISEDLFGLALMRDM